MAPSSSFHQFVAFALELIAASRAKSTGRRKTRTKSKAALTTLRVPFEVVPIVGMTRCRCSMGARRGEMWGDVGRRGEMWGDVGRYGEMWGDVRRCGEMFVSYMGRYGEIVHLPVLDGVEVEGRPREVDLVCRIAQAARVCGMSYELCVVVGGRRVVR